MAIYRWCTKVSWIGRSFNPWNLGCEWQVLTRTQCWYEWSDSQWGWDNWPKVDVLVVAWGWGGSYWGWGWWAVEDCRKFPLWDVTTFAITIWAWWNSACSRYYTGCNWWDSCFLNIVAYWWWGGGKYWWGWTAWWNWWWWGTSSNWWMIWWIWKQWFSWWKWGICWWWWWGWAWWPWLASIHYYDNNSLAYGGVGWQWWQWYYNSFWSECLYWSWGWWWGKVVGDNAFSWWWNWWCQLGTSATYYWWGWGWSWEYSCCWWNWCQWIVIVKYKTNWDCWFTTATWWTITTDWDYTVHTFTSDWTFCITW